MNEQLVIFCNDIVLPFGDKQTISSKDYTYTFWSIELNILFLLFNQDHYLFSYSRMLRKAFHSVLNIRMFTLKQEDSWPGHDYWEY